MLQQLRRKPLPLKKIKAEDEETLNELLHTGLIVRVGGYEGELMISSRGRILLEKHLPVVFYYGNNEGHY